MSPEIIGNNNPPSVMKRKKKKTPTASNSTSTDALNIGFDAEFDRAYDGDVYGMNQEYLPYECPKANCSLPTPPGTQPMSLPVYSNKYPGFIRYPSFQVYPPPPTIPPPFFPQPNPHPNFMAGPMPGPISGPIPGPMSASWNRYQNGYHHMTNNYFPRSRPDVLNNDYTSLPPINLNIEDSKSRRFSDPGLPNESDCSSSSSFENGKSCQKLLLDMKFLKESNRKLLKEVAELRMEVNFLKQSQTCRNYEREYEPGMLADIIREVREATRVREDALLAKVKHVIEEKYLNWNELNTPGDQKNRNNDRILKIEEQLKSISSIANAANNSRSEDTTLLAITPCHSTSSTPITATDKSKSAREVLELEREALELRRELQDTRAKKDESDQKIKQLSKMLQRAEISTSEDGKTSVDSMSTISSVSTVTTPSSLPPVPPRVILSGPVTDL